MDQAPLLENSSFNRELAVQKLILGQEATAELQALLRKPAGDHSETVDGLLKRIIQSFAETIVMMNSGETGLDPLDPAATQNRLSCCDDHQTIKDSEDSVTIPATATDRRRTGYKRRRSSVTWTKVSATPFTDEFGWRKYGQKEILGAKFPRSYFRCTHRNDQGCQATKQVQRMEDDPSNYLITYMGHHTCRSVSRTPQLILDSPSTEPFSLSFEPSFIRKSSSSFSSFQLPIKQEENEEMIMKDFPPYNSSASSSSSENLMQSDLSVFESCGPVTKLPMMSPDEGEGFSRSSTSSDAYMDIPSEFDEMFCFEGGEFF